MQPMFRDFMLYAHPFITQQSSFRKVLDPILLTDWGENTDFEYDFQAEKLSITFNGTNVSTKVFLIRTNPKFTSHLQQTMSRIFAQDSTTELGTLHRYKFIPLTSNAVVPDDMLQGLLRSQKAFSENVFVYVCNNIENIDFQYDIPTPHQQAQEDQESQKAPSTHKLSLREWFYALEASDNSNLIHAVYSIPKTTTIKILCERSKHFPVLEILHNILELVNEYFPTESKGKYFPNYQTQPFTVEKFPKVSAVCGTYASELADFATGNPQGNLPDADARFTETSQEQPSSTSTKRTRQGDPIQQTHHPAAAAATAGLPPSVLEQIASNQKRLESLQQDHDSNETTIGSIETSLTNITSRLSSNESAISTLASTQESQGRLIETIHTRQGVLQTHMTTLCRHFGLEVQPPNNQPNDTDTEMEDADASPPLDHQDQQQQHQQKTPEAPGGENGEPQS